VNAPPPVDTPLERKLAAELQRLRAAQLYRRRRPVRGGHGTVIVVEDRSCINFCSNDYLGLATDPRLAEAARAALARCGTGAGAAALVSGYNEEHARLEEELADFVCRPRALLFSSGWAANLGVLRALLTRSDTVIADELNHASLIDGGRLAGARYLRVPHLNLAGFRAALAQAAGERVLVTDAVFSMDGDRADLPALARLCTQHRATLMVDDAHGLGVLGVQGRGSPYAFDPALRTAEIPIYVATLGKSLGAAGAFVAGSETLIEFLVQRARTWVFSTAAPPALAAAARASLRIVRQEPERRARLLANIAYFRDGARALGIALGGSASTPIQLLILGDAARALALSEHLYRQGLWVAAIRPPTVPPGTARLRITLSAAHRRGEIDRLLEALAQGLQDLGRDVPFPAGERDRSPAVPEFVGVI
jgi:8-amino-7-oxononanoate synthase